MSGATTNSANIDNDLEFYENDQVILVAYVHNMDEPKTNGQTEQSSDKSTMSNFNESNKKKFVTCDLQCQTSWYFAKIFGTHRDIVNQFVYIKLKEAQKEKKAIKLIARKSKDLSK